MARIAGWMTEHRFGCRRIDGVEEAHTGRLRGKKIAVANTIQVEIQGERGRRSFVGCGSAL
jgi:hypothetical protein